MASHSPPNAQKSRVIARHTVQIRGFAVSPYIAHIEPIGVPPIRKTDTAGPRFVIGAVAVKLLRFCGVVMVDMPGPR